MEAENNNDVERQRHPTFDREIVCHALTAIFAISSISIIAFETIWGSWTIPVGVAGFFAGVVFLLGKSINTCVCPVCRSRLVREGYSTEFVCHSCRISWITRCFGENITDPSCD